MQKFLTVSEFCASYKISRTEFYRQVGSGKIKLLKMGRMSRIRIEDANSWAQSLVVKDVQNG